MIASRPRLVALAAGLSTVLASLVGCSAADRALLAAPGCRAATAAPRPAEAVEGTVYAWQPHFDAQNVPEPMPEAEQRGTREPRPVPGWADVVSIASTGYTTFAVRSDGTVWAYGLGHRGALGDGDLSRRVAEQPQPVPGIADARSVHAGGGAVYVVRRDGTVLAWGDGLLAHGGRQGTVGDDLATPAPLAGLQDVVDISAGALTTLALRSDGSVAGWGANLTAMLGDGGGTELRTLSDLPPAVSVAAATGAALVATGAGQVCAWGDNGHGLLAVEPRGGQSASPVGVAGPERATQVAAGEDAGYALDAAGVVWAWGRGVHGALGDGDPTDRVVVAPSPVAGLPPARWIGASGRAAYAIDRDGRLWVWGSGLVIGEQSSAAPVEVPMPGPVVMVSGSHALVANAG